MTPDPDSRLRDEVNELKTAVRITKHDVSNVQQMIIGINTRFDRLESSIKTDMKESRDEFSKELRDLGKIVSDDTKRLSAEISAVNTKQEKGVGFVGGVAAVIVGCVAVLMFLGRALFGGQT